MNGIYNIGTIILLAYLVGSFLNVVIHRLPLMLKLKKKTHPFKKFNLALPSSHCIQCHHPLSWWQNIPLISYLLLRGKCHYCHEKISARYFWVELSYMILIGIGFYQFPQPQLFFWVSVFISLALVIFIIDLETMMIPDLLNYLLLWSGLMANSFGLFCNLQSAVYGAIFGYLGLWGFYHLIFWTTKKQGFGYGDFKLMAALGAWLGVFQIFNILFIGSLLGLVFALMRRKKIGEPIPFGPSLCVAGFLILVFPKQFGLLIWNHQLF